MELARLACPLVALWPRCGFTLFYNILCMCMCKCMYVCVHVGICMCVCVRSYCYLFSCIANRIHDVVLRHNGIYFYDDACCCSVLHVVVAVSVVVLQVVCSFCAGCTIFRLKF